MNSTSKRNKLIRSTISLVLIMTLLITASYAWLSNRVNSKIESQFITITADAGLNMEYGEGFNNSGIMQIDENVVLAECSSIDGKNFFFPLSAYSDNPNADKDFTNENNNFDFLYRQASALDKNRKYISLEVEFSADKYTEVWLTSDSKIRNTNSNDTSANAVRVAFVENKPEGNSIVFCNSIDEDASRDKFGYPKDESAKNNAYKPIKIINEDGSLISTEADETLRPHAFSEYYHGNEAGNVLFKLQPGQPLSITVNIWLEGADAECVDSVLGIKDLEIKINFITTYEIEAEETTATEQPSSGSDTEEETTTSGSGEAPDTSDPSEGNEPPADADLINITIKDIDYLIDDAIYNDDAEFTINYIWNNIAYSYAPDFDDYYDDGVYFTCEIPREATNIIFRVEGSENTYKWETSREEYDNLFEIYYDETWLWSED